MNRNVGMIGMHALDTLGSGNQREQFDGVCSTVFADLSRVGR